MQILLNHPFIDFQSYQTSFEGSFVDLVLQVPKFSRLKLHLERSTNAQSIFEIFKTTETHQHELWSYHRAQFSTSHTFLLQFYLIYKKKSSYVHYDRRNTTCALTSFTETDGNFNSRTKLPNLVKIITLLYLIIIKIIYDP